MKATYYLFLPISTLVAFAAEIPPLTPGGTAIIGPIPDGSIPSVHTPIKSMDVRPSDILTRKSMQVSGRQMTFERIVPQVLAVLPPPRARKEFQSPAHPQIEAIKPTVTLMLGAGVFVPPGQPEKAITRLQLWPGNGKGPLTFYCNANFLWLTGFATFETATTRYHSIMAISPGANVPSNLKFADPTKASLIITEGTPTEEELAPIEALLEIYNNPETLTKLKIAYERRLSEAARVAAERAANPPERKNLVLRYWRLDSGKSANEQSEGGVK